MRTRIHAGSVILCAMVLLWTAGVADAVPEWARKYETSCVTCHEAFPRLTAVGEAFRLNGYRFPDDDEAYIQVEPINLGDPAYKRVWPDALWPNEIPGMPPVSVRIISDFVAEIGDVAGGSEPRTNFDFPHEVEIFLAGTFGDEFSFFAEVEFEGGGTATDAFISWDDLLGDTVGENRLNLRVGTVGGWTLDLPGSNDAGRIGKGHYLKNDWRLPYPGGFGTTNRFRLRSQPGVEIYGFDSRYKYAAGIVNGQGSNTDNNSGKDLFFQFAWKFGGLGFDGGGSSSEGEGIPSSPGGGWVDDSVQVGVLGYLGSARVVDPAGIRDDDSFWKLGFDGKAKWRDFGGTGGIILGNFDDPYGTSSTESVDTLEWFVEGYWFAYPWLIGSVRYETLAIDTDRTLFTSDQDKARFVPTITALATANVKLVIEGVFHTINDAAADKDDDDRIFARLEWAF